MKIELRNYKIRDIVEGYQNNEEEGVIAFNGKLNVRPKYQREFVYKDQQRDEVINTIRKKFPLNVMYWSKSDDGESYEVLDGQQRTISFCEFCHSKFSINNQYFHTLPEDIQNEILDYELFIYVCEGTQSERLDWFKVINIAGEKLTDQELRNATYTGEWLTDAKKHFSKTNCPAYGLASNYLTGNCIRQDYLETALDWISNGQINQYMADHQRDPNANELWLYFTAVINWVQTIFPVYRKEMKGIQWGKLYNRFKDNSFDTNALEQRIQVLLQDEDVTRKSGIYEYLIDGDERHLSIRAFSPNQKREAYQRQGGVCPICGNHFEIEEMEGDHITPWHLGGKTTAENCQMLCKECNRRKSGI